jgi:hypothetical protein
VNVDDLPIYVIDYLFLKIQSKSVGEIIDANYKCNNLVNKPEKRDWEGKVISEAKENVPCNTKFSVEIDLNDAYIKYPPNYNAKCIIKISDDIGMRLKSPNFSKFHSVNIAGKGNFDISDEYIFACVDCVFDGDKILIPGKDFTLEELGQFIEDFPSDTIKEISNFFRNQPVVSLKMEIMCPVCKNKSIVELNGLSDFFD